MEISVGSRLFLASTSKKVGFNLLIKMKINQNKTIKNFLCSLNFSNSIRLQTLMEIKFLNL